MAAVFALQSSSSEVTIEKERVCNGYHLKSTNFHKDGILRCLMNYCTITNENGIYPVMM
jgi:hypothetical protein